MAKFRKRVKGQSKGKRWPKGQSSNSNPSTNKFRTAAKTRFFEPLPGPSMLTKEAVEKHTAKVTNNDVPMAEEDLESFGGKTFKTFDTFASDWSSCSNESFSRLINNFKPDSAMHKDMLAVLAAVTEVIKEKGGNESSTEYFAALMTALDSEGNTDDTTAAILNLLSMGIKTVPQNVLQSKFSESSTRLIAVLSKFSESERQTVIRATLGLLSVLLRAQDAAAWGNPATLQVLDVLLSFIAYSKPKVRRAGQHGVTVVVRDSKITDSALSHVAKFCIKLVESAALGNVTTTLHTFNLLKDILHVFPKKDLKSCCESVLKVMTLNNVMITSCGLQVLHSMFQNSPERLAAPDAARLLNALWDYQPPPTDSQPTQAWLATLQEAYLFLAKSDLSLCMVNLPKLFTTCATFFTGNRAETLTAATHTLQAVISECLSSASRPEVLPRHQQEILKVIGILKECFSYEYHPAWCHVLHLISALFQACGDTCSKLLVPVLKVLVDLRDSDQFTFINELENTIGVAVKHMGPELILSLVPLQFNPNDRKGEFKRSWLLPVLKDNIRRSNLKTFIEHFLPLATTCKHISEELRAKNEQIRAVGYDLLQTQIWSLLPSFANEPKDIALSFPVIAKALGGVLNSRKDLRSIVFTALRKLVAFAMNNENKEDLNTMAKYAKNYLPIFFSIYTTKAKGSDEEGSRLAAFETIKVYLKIAQDETRKQLFSKVFEKVDSGEADDFLKESALDLARALLPYQSKEDVSNFYEKTIAKIKDCDEQRKQKKYYRLLEEICTAQSEVLDEFVNEKLDEIREMLVTTLSKSASSSKGPRLRCILDLLKRLKDPLPFALLILPETILCVKEINAKCRETAFEILAHIAQNLHPNDYFHVISAGLSGNPSMMTCSLLAASLVVYHAKDKISEDIEQHLLYCVQLLAICSTREIVSAALSFIKVYMQSFSREKVAAFLPDLVKLMSKMTDDCKRHTRNKTRDILARLVRWFGADEVRTHVPDEDTVLIARLRNLRKIEDHKKRLREAASRASSASAPLSTFSVASRRKTIEEILADSDSDLDDDEEEERDKRKKDKKGKVWITEDGEDIVDLKDVNTAKKITAIKPGSFAEVLEKKKLKKKKSEFKTAPDGRLIIADKGTDNDDDEDDDNINLGKKKKKKTPIADLGGSDDDYEMSEDDALTSLSTVGGMKRTRSEASIGSLPPFKYQAGGKGIHRAVGAPSVAASSQKSGRSRKGKDRGQEKGPKPRTGEEYRAKKAGGDMKRRGLPDPYAYLPLRRDALNKRKRAKALGQMKNILKKAQHGAKVGTKLKKMKNR